jgi:hypothetical protein
MDNPQGKSKQLEHVSLFFPPYRVIGVLIQVMFPGA